MWELTPDFAELAGTLTCDEDLLLELGRVTWAAVGLHRDIRSVIEQLGQAPTEQAGRSSLAEAVRELESVADRHAIEPHRGVVLTWCRSVGAAAARSRDGVVEQIVLGAPGDAPERYGRTELVEVTGRLVNASRTLPVRPDAVGEPDPTPRYTRVVAAAEQAARERGHRYLGVEHLLLALLEDEPPSVTTRTIERAGGASPAALRDDLDTLIGRHRTAQAD